MYSMFGSISVSMSAVSVVVSVLTGVGSCFNKLRHSALAMDCSTSLRLTSCDIETFGWDCGSIFGVVAGEVLAESKLVSMSRLAVLNSALVCVNKTCAGVDGIIPEYVGTLGIVFGSSFSSWSCCESLAPAAADMSS